MSQTLSSKHGKRRRTPDAGDENVVSKKSCETSRREYGDTYATGNAIVHNGDNLTFYQTDNSLQHEVEALQNSLAFPAMHQRYESLREAHDGTYEWILSPSIEIHGEDADDASEADKDLAYKQQQINPFHQWYETGTGIFWISGKPGSGKSTLMKYLIEHVENCETTSTSDQSVPVVLSYFFWIAGDDLQRNKLGFLRSLLWQLLDNPVSQQIALQKSRIKARYVWTEHRLQTELTAIFRNLERPIVLFVDGVDESKDQEEVLDFLDNISSSHNLRVCVSSRPEPTFVQNFQGRPNLKVQDLNKKDIQCFVKKKLLQDSRIAAMRCIAKTGQRNDDLEALAERIGWISEGVFLWVHLVVKDLLKGITNKDNIQTLHQRLDRLPKDIHDLYQDMLRRNQDDASLYQEDAALYFALILHNEFNLLEFCFAIDDDLRNKYLQPSIFDDDSELGTEIPCDLLQTQIHARTAGLLEVVPNGKARPNLEGRPRARRNGQLSDLNGCIDLRVCFIHRTARDFLYDTAAGNSLLSLSKMTETKVRKTCFQAKLVVGLVLPVLQGQGFSFLVHGSGVFGCETCTDENVYEGICEQEQILRSSSQANDFRSCSMLCFDCPKYYVSVGYIPSSMVPSGHTVWDLTLILLLSGRTTVAKSWLLKHDFVKDTTYLCGLLAALCGFILFRKPDQLDSADCHDLLRWFVKHGVNTRETVINSSGEVLSALGDVLKLSRHLDGDSYDSWKFLDAMGITHDDLPTQTLPTCYACHADCLERSPFSSIHRIYKLWGRFCPAAKALQDYECEQLTACGKTSTRLVDEQILVLGAFLSKSLHGDSPSKSLQYPILWTISEADSRWLIGTLKVNSIAYGPIDRPMPYSGFFEIWDKLPDRFFQNLNDVCNRSPVVSFAEVMKYMGKSDETIRVVYQEEAKRMTHSPEHLIESWRSWYWRSSAPTLRGTEAECNEPWELPNGPVYRSWRNFYSQRETGI